MLYHLNLSKVTSYAIYSCILFCIGDPCIICIFYLFRCFESGYMWQWHLFCCWWKWGNSCVKWKFRWRIYWRALGCWLRTFDQVDLAQEELHNLILFCIIMILTTVGIILWNFSNCSFASHAVLIHQQLQLYWLYFQHHLRNLHAEEIFKLDKDAFEKYVICPKCSS